MRKLSYNMLTGALYRILTVLFQKNEAMSIIKNALVLSKLNLQQKYYMNFSLNAEKYK
mgnify:CR=1 FL=1